jgi:hypothetical protein
MRPVLQYSHIAKAAPRITWQIEEYTHKEKGPDWFWALGVIAIAGAAIAVIYHDVLFAIFIVLAAIILGYYAAREPKIIEISISDDGIRIRNYFYSFAKLKGFAIDDNGVRNHLLIESDRLVMPLIAIALPITIDTEALAELLETKIPMLPLKEHMSRQIMEHLGF